MGDLQGPNDAIKPLEELLEQTEDDGSPPPAHVPQRATSCPSLGALLRPDSLTVSSRKKGGSEKNKNGGHSWEALQISGHDVRPGVIGRSWDALDTELTESSMGEYTWVILT